MNSKEVKYLMELFGETWEEVLDRHDRQRKECIAEGGKIFFNWAGEEYRFDAETIKTLEEFELANSIDPTKTN